MLEPSDESDALSEPNMSPSPSAVGTPTRGVPAAADDSVDWMSVTFASRSPGSRVFPSAVVHGDSLYIFGGHDGGVYRNDLLVFNLETRVWLLDLELTGGGPSPGETGSRVSYQRDSPEMRNL